MWNEAGISGSAVRSIPSEDFYYLIQQTGLAANTSRGLGYGRPRMIDPWLLLKSISAGVAVAAPAFVGTGLAPPGVTKHRGAASGTPTGKFNPSAPVCLNRKM